MLHLSIPTRQIVVPLDDRLGTLFPDAPRIDYDGEELIVVPHGWDETRLFRNLGYPELPSPIEAHYDFPSIDGKRPFKAQLLTSVSMVANPRSFVLNGMGTGKTKSAIWAFDYLCSTGRANKMLVTCPKSTVRFTWEREIFNTCPQLRVKVLVGTAARRKQLLAEDADIYIVNHHGEKVIHAELMLRPDIDVICFDEVAVYRGARNDISKCARQLAQNRKFVWGMTGSPTPSEPTDAFGLAALIVPQTAPRSFIRFRDETMLRIGQWKWVPKRAAADIVANVLSPAVRFTLDEIVELPPVYEREVQIEMGREQAKTYQMLKDHAAAMLKDGTITAVNGGVVYSKLLQTSIGWVYGDDGNTYELDNHKRVEALLDIIMGNVDSLKPEAKIIIFSPFLSAMDGIAKALKAHKVDFATVSGKTPPGERARIFQEFQHGDTLRVINAHPECMSHGLTLTAADTIIWFGPTTKLETYEQACARITRIGQTRKQQIIKLVSSEAEHLAYARLALKQDLQTNVLDIIAELTAEE